MRVIVTGSRDWGDKFSIANELFKLHSKHGDDLLIVHGDNRDPDCADSIAHSHALMRSIEIQRWPVSKDEWKAYGRAAGPYRNRRMVSAGADLCLAFIRPCSRPRCPDRTQHGSHGASDCAVLAIAAGIDTRIQKRGWSYERT